MSFTVAALYRFLALADPAALRDDLRDLFIPTDLCGTLILAHEGINGTLAGSPATVDRLLTLLATRTGLPREDVKFSHAEDRPFGRLKFLLRSEIIPFRHVRIDHTRTGAYVDPQDWNALIASPDVLLLDTRNHYEVEAGTFTGAVNPQIETFSDFATWVRTHLDPATTPRVAMFCTGGIRCEKASAFMLQEGFHEVHHLKGGILRYLEEVPQNATQWQGNCFVFDRRATLTHADFTKS